VIREAHPDINLVLDTHTPGEPLEVYAAAREVGYLIEVLRGYSQAMNR